MSKKQIKNLSGASLLKSIKYDQIMHLKENYLMTRKNALGIFDPNHMNEVAQFFCPAIWENLSTTSVRSHISNIQYLKYDYEKMAQATSSLPLNMLLNYVIDNIIHINYDGFDDLAEVKWKRLALSILLLLEKEHVTDEEFLFSEEIIESIIVIAINSAFSKFNFILRDRNYNQDKPMKLKEYSTWEGNVPGQYTGLKVLPSFLFDEHEVGKKLSVLSHSFVEVLNQIIAKYTSSFGDDDDYYMDYQDIESVIESVDIDSFEKETFLKIAKLACDNLDVDHFAKTELAQNQYETYCNLVSRLKNVYDVVIKSHLYQFSARIAAEHRNGFDKMIAQKIKDLEKNCIKLNRDNRKLVNKLTKSEQLVSSLKAKSQKKQPVNSNEKELEIIKILELKLEEAQKEVRSEANKVLKYSNRIESLESSCRELQHEIETTKKHDVDLAEALRQLDQLKSFTEQSDENKEDLFYKKVEALKDFRIQFFCGKGNLEQRLKSLLPNITFSQAHEIKTFRLSSAADCVAFHTGSIKHSWVEKIKSDAPNKLMIPVTVMNVEFVVDVLYTALVGSD